MCRTVMDESIIGRAQRAGHIQVHCHNIRDYAGNKHNRVDDNLSGGGKGMIMEPGPLYACCEDICARLGVRPKIILMSPRGAVFTQQKAVELGREENLLLVCGHYEGVDQRFIDEMVDEELSIATMYHRGELPALVVADAVCRLCDGVLADPSCFTEESHYTRLLEHPTTRARRMAGP
jgi:tRNA (guanine37-N1)-methyltransferase